MGPLIEQIPIELPGGVALWCSLYRTGRPDGRRIVVRDADGTTLHDTSDAYDLGNALDSLDRWLAERYGPLALPAAA